MTPAEEKIATAVTENSILFMREAVDAILRHDDTKDSALSKSTAVLASAFIQMALELAVIATLIREKGVAGIVEKKQANETTATLVTHFAQNTLKTRKFEELKLILRQMGHFTESDLAVASTFQAYRNKLMHFVYNFHEDELYDVKYEFIYLLTHVLPKLISATYVEPWDFFEAFLVKEQFQKLIQFPPYISKMETLARELSEKVYRCFWCDNRTLAIDERICCVCVHDYERPTYGFTECFWCGASRAVLYDAGNIDAQRDHCINGRCLNCDAKCTVFKCPACLSVNMLEGRKETDGCSQGRCEFGTKP